MSPASASRLRGLEMLRKEGSHHQVSLSIRDEPGTRPLQSFVQAVGCLPRLRKLRCWEEGWKGRFHWEEGQVAISCHQC